MKSLGRADRFIHQVIGPFRPIAPTILQGIDLQYRQKMHPHLPAQLSEAEELQLARYRKVVSAIPGLDEQVQYTKDYHARELVHLAAFLEHASSKDHTEDLEMIRKHAERYTSVYGYTDIGGTKDDLSHHDITAARLLCPRRLRDQFGMDMEYFYDDIRNGDRPYSCSDWPSFLYPKTVYNPDAIKKGLMRGPFLFSCYLEIFARPCKRVIKLSPQNIAYVAVLCFYYLAGGGTSSQYKGDIDYYNNLYWSIVDVFDNEGWAGGTLSWWAIQILEQLHSIRRGRRVCIEGGTD